MSSFNLKENTEWANSLIKNSLQEMNKVVIGQDKMLTGMLLGLFSSGHVLLEGVPGLAKTLAIKSIAKILDLNYKRIQFTPDLLPADLIGTMIYRQETGEFLARKGPIFSNIILADEINRAPAKVQSALLEAMEENQVTIGEETYDLPSPFFVLATQNPIDQEGTYRLPEAQMDRFMLKLKVDFPSIEDEIKIVKSSENIKNKELKLQKIISSQDLNKIKKLIEMVKIDDRIVDYIVKINSLSRTKENNYEFRHFIEYGASLRASIGMFKGAKAKALFDGRGYVIPEDVKYIANAVLRHRILLSYEGESEGFTSDDIIKIILSNVKVP